MCENYKPKYAVQVCETLLDKEKTKDKEINGLLEAMKDYKLNSGLIITRNDEAQFKIDDKMIQVVPAWKYFLITPL